MVSSCEQLYIFSMGDRLPHSKELFWDMVDQLESWNFFPDQPAVLIFLLCPRGLEMTRRIDKKSLAVILWHLYRFNPSNKIRFLPRGAT